MHSSAAACSGACWACMASRIPYTCQQFRSALRLLHSGCMLPVSLLRAILQQQRTFGMIRRSETICQPHANSNCADAGPTWSTADCSGMCQRRMVLRAS